MVFSYYNQPALTICAIFGFLFSYLIIFSLVAFSTNLPSCRVDFGLAFLFAKLALQRPISNFRRNKKGLREVYCTIFCFKGVMRVRLSNRESKRDSDQWYTQSTYFTVRGQSYFSRLPKYWSPIPSPPDECVPPAFVAWGGQTRRAERGIGGGGQYFGRREK